MKITIGESLTSNTPFELDVQEHLINRGLAILGKRGSGKSYSSGKICEELLETGQPIIVIDPMGEYASLKERYPIIVIGFGNPEYADVVGVKVEDAGKIARLTILNNQSVIIDLKNATMKQKFMFLSNFLSSLYEVERTEKKPYVLVLEEAHQLCPEKSMVRLKDIKEYQNKVLYWVYEIASTGRHLGLGFILVARRTAEISKSVLAQCELKFIFKVDGVDLERLKAYIPPEMLEKARNLAVGECIVTGIESPDIVKILPRKCTHKGVTPKVKPVSSPAVENFVRTLLEAISTKKPMQLPVQRESRNHVKREIAKLEKRIKELERENAQLRATIAKILEEMNSFMEKISKIASEKARVHVPLSRMELSGIIEYTGEGPLITVPVDRLSVKSAIAVLLYAVYPKGLKLSEIYSLLRKSMFVTTKSSCAARLNELGKLGYVLKEKRLYRLSLQGVKWVKDKLLPSIKSL
ncbi:hypothetical protein DRO02_05690 [archaeon]|nr:MAG: hypothetical protein DRO02_05690 [archaeon]RLG65137.1 MAG: hypothetical protein DRO21_02705 [archaeon]HDM23731.1 DUF87 domain-containing protein [Candidatus Bathyarchaeota archaeon]